MNNGGWGTARTKNIAACHPDRPHYAKGLCRGCYRNSPFMQVRRRAYYDANREHWVRYSAQQRERRSRQVSAYGLPANELERLLASQDGRCALCGSPPKRKRLALDHCHRTGHVRAFLCHPCNGALGLLKDDPSLCERAAAYLRHHSVLPSDLPAPSS